MKIKKMFQGSIPENKILNIYSDSQTDVYSCDYVNKTNTYLTEEQRIGTWIDKKPLYRRIAIVNISSSSSGSQILSFSGWNVETIILDYGKSYHKLTNNNTLNIDFFYSTSDWSRTYTNSNGVYFNYGSSLTAKGTMVLFLEYTKTTD